MNEFVHLHVHSEYSLRESTLRIRDAVEQAVALGMSALAITDTNALYGAIPFYHAAKAGGIRPIIGVQLHVADVDEGVDPATPAGQTTVASAQRTTPPHRAAIAAAPDTAVLLAKDFRGYQDLVKLVTCAHQRIRRPSVTFDELAAHSGHTIALIGGGESRILRHFSDGRDAEAERWLKRWQAHWPAEDLYVDVQDHALAWERKGLPGLVRYARSHQISMVATNDVHYAEPEDAGIQRVLAQMDNHPDARQLEGDRYHLASQDEMWHRFSKLPEATENALVVADRCQFELPQPQLLLPKYPTENGEPASVVLRRAAEAGAKLRYGSVEGAVRERMDYELCIIEKLGFSDYFLVVADFIRHAHKQGISTGPGRGSAASSLVAYALRITDVDPLRHKLLFERFLNPERVTWPDIDTDFEYERRGEVIQYVVDRYGVHHVAQIGTFGTLAAKAAIRDTARVLQTDAKLVNQLAKQIPSAPGMTLARALKEVDALRTLIEQTEAARTLWETAAKLEGLPRHTSTHAAGVIISPVPITTLVPTQPGADGTPVTQYPMETVEQLGLMKMDFLGLRTLTLIDRCVASVEKRMGKRIDWRKVPMDDHKTFQMLTRGEVDGCFQLESGGVRRVLRDLKPTHFDDLVAVISLYRPGPMENIPAFIAAKHGRVPVQYPHPDLEPILQDTYGVIVYQEQIMQIASRMAGFSMGQADLLRRAVGKKKREVLDAERSRFVAGCTGKGYDEETANHVYDLIVRFADYGFPLSHASAYAVLAYRTAWLRANWFADFIAALLTMTFGDEAKVKAYSKDAKAHGVEVRPPSVIHSELEFRVEPDGHIRTGLLSIKNVGRAAVEAILDARADEAFSSLADFVGRVNHRACNRRAVESLLLAGALSDFIPAESTPAAALTMLEEAYNEAGQEGAGGLGLVFDGDGRGRAQERTRGVQGAGGGRGAHTTSRQTTHNDEVDGEAAHGDDVLFIRYNPRLHGPRILHTVRRVLSQYPGPTGVALFNEQDGRLRLLEDKWHVRVQPELISLLEESVGIGNAKMGRRPTSRRR